MKKIMAVLLLSGLLYLTGCSFNINPSSPSSPSPKEESEGTVARVAIIIEPLGSLGKAMAIDAPTHLIFGWDAGKSWDGENADTVLLDTMSSDTLRRTVKGLARAKDYTFIGITFADGVEPDNRFNLGYTTVTVPDVDTFSLNLNLISIKHKIKIKIPLKGTPVEAIACSVSCWWTYVTTGLQWTDSATAFFEPGILDTAYLSSLMRLSNSDESYDFDVTITVYNSDGSFYKGTARVTVSPSTNSSLVVPLEYWSNGTVLGEIYLAVKPIGELGVTVEFL